MRIATTMLVALPLVLGACGNKADTTGADLGGVGREEKVEKKEEKPGAGKPVQAPMVKQKEAPKPVAMPEGGDDLDAQPADAAPADDMLDEEPPARPDDGEAMDDEPAEPAEPAGDTDE